MSAYNVVRFRVKAGGEEKFVRAHEEARLNAAGFRHGALVKTGERTYCFIGEWDSYDDIVAARSQMIPILDRFRDTLEDLGNGLGVTDPVSGETVVEMKRSG